ncbi:MAG: carbohydrate ABC transporter permease [Bacillota bacterium]|nr:carbohydrate ABC transporter permease [Bacillota bacterium]
MFKKKGEKIGDYVFTFICALFILACFLPLVNVLARSLSSPEAIIRNKVTLWPRGLNFDAYRSVLSDSKYTWSLAWTAILTVICTIVSMVMTTMCAYPLTYVKLKGRRIINVFIIFTMYFSAGAIPNYLLYKDLNLINKPLVLIIPACLSVFNMIIMRSFLDNIPESIRESAEIDGAGPTRILLSIYIPLSIPVIATLSLFYAVGRWNGFSDALMFMNNRQYYPIQLLLYNIINSISRIDSSKEGFVTPGVSETLKSATVIFALLPILMIYPWLQRYFISGVTIGAVKG